jgi:hypothetical protein
MTRAARRLQMVQGGRPLLPGIQVPYGGRR